MGVCLAYLIAAEPAFDISFGQGELSWFIAENRYVLDIAAMFAGLLAVIVIGLMTGNRVFCTIERYTIGRWSMQA